MTPTRLLLLWRMRWGKPSSAEQRPYVQGVVLKWMQRLINSGFWRVPGFSFLSWAMCLSVLLLTPAVQLSDNGQIFWSAMLLAFAIGARRYEGHVYVLMLAGLALAAGLRYFYWRITGTLDMHHALGFAQGFALLAAEFFWACMALCALGQQLVGSLRGGGASAWGRALAFFQFYVPLPRALLFVIPLVGVAWRTPVMQASVEMLLVFGLPYWVLGRFAQAALETQGRVSLFVFVREHLVAFAVLCRTAGCVVRTWGSELWERKAPKRFLHAPARADSTAPLPLRVVLLYGGGFLLHVLVLGVALTRDGWQLLVAESGIYTVYVVWVVYNAMRLLAALAAHKELALVEHARAQGAQLSAMVRLESGHAVTCRTVNFPAMRLALQLPTDNPVAKEPLHVTIFRGYRGYTFPAKVHSQDGARLSIDVEGTCADEYQALSDDVFTRDAFWPQWLAGKQADILLPQWVHGLADMAETAFYNLVVRVSKRSVWQTCLSWFQRGK